MERLFSTLPLLSVPPSQLDESTAGIRKWIVRDSRDAGQQQTRLINLTNGSIEKGFPSSVPHSVNNSHELLLRDQNLTHDALEIYPHGWNQKVQHYLSQKMNQFYSKQVKISKKTYIFEHVIEVLDTIYNSILDYQEYPYMIWYQIENFRKLIFHVEQIINKWNTVPHSKSFEKWNPNTKIEESESSNELEEKLKSRIEQYKQKSIVSQQSIRVPLQRKELANYLVSYLFREKHKVKHNNWILKSNFEDCFDKHILFFNFSKKMYQKWELLTYFSHLLESSKNSMQFLKQICQWTLENCCKELTQIINWNRQIIDWKKQLKTQFLKEKQKLSKKLELQWLNEKTEVQRMKFTKFEELYSLENNEQEKKQSRTKQQTLILKKKLLVKYQMHMYSTILKEGLTKKQKKIVSQYLILCNTCLQYQSILQHSIYLLKKWNMDCIGSIQFEQLIRNLIKDVSQQRQMEEADEVIEQQIRVLFDTILPRLQVTPGIRLCQKHQLLETIQKKHKSVTSLHLLQGIYENEDYLFCSLVGHVHIDTTTLPSTAQISVQTSSSSSIVNKNNYLIVPELNSTVLCRVLRVNNAMAKCNILSVNGKALYYEFPAMIRQQDVRATEIDKVVMGECFRPGDIVQAQILSLGDQRNYYLTTAKNELGVVYAKCSQSQSVMVPLNWNTMQCLRTGIQEPRKVAKWNIS